MSISSYNNVYIPLNRPHFAHNDGDTVDSVFETIFAFVFCLDVQLAANYIAEQNDIRGDFSDVEEISSILAGGVSLIAQLGGPIALVVLADSGGSLLARSVAWTTSNQAVIGGVSALTSMGILIGGGYLLYKIDFFRKVIHWSAQLIYRTVRWIVDDAFTKEYWQYLFLKAKSHVGCVTAADINCLKDNQLKYVHAGLFKNLPKDELLKIDERILDHLPSHEKEKIERIRREEDMAIVDALNSSSDAGEDISVEQVNALSKRAAYYLSSSVLSRLREQPGSVYRLSSHVLNNLSEITLAELEPTIFRDLPPETLQGLEARVFNGSSHPLDEWLPNDIKRRLSVMAISLRGIPSILRPAITDIETPNIRRHVLEGRRAYWVDRDGYGHYFRLMSDLGVFV